ncbi:cadmium resistance transporter [Streptomyces sp. NPDC091268]|uniref:cadmium resistance transporter n=1 Tax=Streptomyces sp. NPDC091268 TaxID=3365979 RepID=UPI0037F369EF
MRAPGSGVSSSAPSSARWLCHCLPGGFEAQGEWQQTEVGHDGCGQEGRAEGGGHRQRRGSRDNIGVYVPVFATAGVGGMTVYAVVFLALVAVWCFAGRYFATRPPVAKVLARWGHVLLPLVLIAIGLLILIEGGAFGL